MSKSKDDQLAIDYGKAEGEEFTGEDVPEIDPAEEKKLVRKLDLYIVPPVMLLYLLSFLDRVNIGNAKLYGMVEDLNLYGDRYVLSVSILFVTYILSELPSNLVIKKFRPSRWISFIATSWGIIATLQGIVQSYGGLIATRLLLGAVEGGLFPGMAVYLTLFYTKQELALRIGYLFVSAALAGACGGLLAYAISFMDGLAGQRGWRWIFIIEGLPTFVVGIATWWYLANDAQSAWYLTPREKHLMDLRRQRQAGHTSSAEEFNWDDVKKGLKDWKIYVFCVGQMGGDTMLYSYSTFLPTIIEGLDLGYSSAVVQALTIPCFSLGAITYLIVAHVSDKQQKRAIYPIVFGVVSVVGYGILVSSVSNSVRYFGCFLVAMGLYVLVGIPLAWLPTNCPRYGKRTTAVGLQLTLGNTAGIWAAFLYPDTTGPRYVQGHAATMSLVAMSCCIYGFLWWYFSRKNRRRLDGKEDHKIQGMSEADIAELGDESPRFTFTT